ncbi:MAG TPA: hypothetical protein VKB80_07980 [Kofleriaceae bacterium]|nr:hypothetical protein [Kofleriaceae bacterium]
MPRAVAVALAAALLAASAVAARADIDGDQFESSAWRVHMTAPKNWQLTEKTAYPSILLRLVRRAPDGKMMLAAERLAPGVTALAYAQRTAGILRAMRFEVRSPQLHSSTGAYFIDSQGRGAFLRQAFLVAGGIGYSLTLSAPDNRTRSQHLRAFDFALRSIQILHAPAPPPPERPEQSESKTPASPSPIEPGAPPADDEDHRHEPGLPHP